MSRIAPPSTDLTPAAAQTLLAAVQQQLGMVPNLMKTLAHSPAALEGYLSLMGALAKGRLGAKTGERVALAVAEFNACGYCLAAHSYLGQHVAKLDGAEITAARAGSSGDAKARAALGFALRVAEARGHVADGDVAAVKAAGFGDAEVLELVAHVALNVLTNYVNSVAGTEVDFPAVIPVATA